MTLYHSKPFMLNKFFCLYYGESNIYIDGVEKMSDLQMFCNVMSGSNNDNADGRMNEDINGIGYGKLITHLSIYLMKMENIKSK